jgi:hypothetical protein
MGFLIQLHGIFGERVLPLLIIIAAIWLTVVWKPDAPRSPVARIFPILVDLQVTLGILIWVLGLFNGVPYYLQFPFILHPILGLLAAGVAHMAVGQRNPLSNLGRFAPLASLAILLVVVLGNIVIATTPI